MNDQSLYWTLSTLPQVCAALVAFIGFFILQSLDEPTRRRDLFEKECKEGVGGLSPTAESSFHGMDYNVISAMDPDTFMARFELAVEKHQFKIRANWPSDYSSRWSEMNRYIKNARARLAKFVTLNLVAISASLLLLPIVPRIADYGVATGLVLGAAGITTVEIVRRALQMIDAAMSERRQ